MSAVSCAQLALLLHHAQALYNLSVAERITPIDSCLVGRCSGFPLIAEFALPAFQMANDFFCLLGAYSAADGAWHIVSTHQPGEVNTFEIEFNKLGFVFTKKTLFANRFNDTDTMTGMINAITLIDSDNVLLVSEIIFFKKINIISMLHDFDINFKVWLFFWLLNVEE
jgi:hypothetical protein